MTTPPNSDPRAGADGPMGGPGAAQPGAAAGVTAGAEDPRSPGAAQAGAPAEPLDLSAVRTPVSLANPAADSASAGPGPNQVEVPALVFDVTEQTFEAALRLSMELPVVFALVSGQSPASQGLVPVLRQAVEAQDGALVLGVIDIDHSPGVQQAFQVQSVPTVIAVIKGQPVPLFQGTQPEAQIRQVFAQVTAAAAQAGPQKTAWVPGSPAQAGPKHPAALEALEAGDLDGAEEVYRAALADAPADAEAKEGLARVGLLRRTRELDLAAVRQAAADDPTSVQAALDCADLDIAGGHVDDAFTRLITLIGTTSGDDREKLRLRLLDLFEAVGAADPRVVKARGRLMRALF